MRGRSLSGRIFSGCNGLFMLLMIFITAYPLYYCLIASFSDPIQLALNPGALFLPLKPFTLSAYQKVLEHSLFLSGVRNTLFVLCVGTLLNMALTILTGYALSRKGAMLIVPITFYIVFTMYFSGGLVPTFLLVSNLGLYNTRAVLVILGAFSTYNCIICRTFFAALPKELDEAAFIDGCSPLRVFFQIALPLSQALLGVMVLYFAVGHWNSYFNAMMYINNEAYKPLQLILRRILILEQASADMMASGGDEYAAEQFKLKELVQYAVIVVSSLPVLILYPFLQKYFAQGVMIGSLKG